MTLEETKPTVDAADAPPDDDANDAPPSYTGDTGELAAIYESSGFNAIKELLDFDQSFESVMPKANLSRPRANLMRRMLMKEMVEQTGSLDRIELMKAEAYISVAVEGERANQIVRIMSGVREGVENLARGGLERMREMGRRF